MTDGTARGGDEVRRTVLPCGVRVVTERVPGARSLTTGVYVGVGARDEPPHLQGASHYLEHLLFKGTADRSARDIARAVDAVGGEMNAYTAREHTVFTTRMPSQCGDLGLDLLADVVTRPAFRPKEIDAEREVILDEIHMVADDPDDVCHTALWDALFPDHPVGREVLGTIETVGAIGRDDLVAFHGDWYRPGNVVVAAAGDLDHDRLAEAVEARFSGLPAGAPPTREAPGRGARDRAVEIRDTEQVHVALGWRGLSRDDEDRYALAVANQVLGGSPSSRLFQEIREERGLVYSIGSAPALYSDCGAVTVSAGTAPDRLDEVLGLVDDILGRLRAGGTTAEERRVACGYLEGSLLLSLEDSGARMERVAGDELRHRQVVALDEHLERIRAVDVDDVTRVVRRVFDGPGTTALVGPPAAVGSSDP